MRRLALYAVTSGWDGPFQLAEVVVAAESPDAAIAHAEGAFDTANQPICRAKMRIAKLGPVAEGVVCRPREAGAPLEADWHPVDRRCDPQDATSS
jgi:hypothetical protein